MTNALRLETPRLGLVAATAEMARAEIEDLDRLAELLGARLPFWPPRPFEEGEQRAQLQLLEEDPSTTGWTTWYFLLPLASGRIAIGRGGFKGKPTEHGGVELTYSLMPSYEREDYARDAVRGLLSWAFMQERVGTVLAYSPPQSGLELRVLEECGFVRRNEPADARDVFELRRPSLGASQ